MTLVNSESSSNFLSRGQGDVLYCKQGGDCILSNLTVTNYFNASVTSYNVVGNVNVTGNISAEYYCDNSGNCYSIAQFLVDTYNTSSEMIAALTPTLSDYLTTTNFTEQNLTMRDYVLWVNTTNPGGSGSGTNNITGNGALNQVGVFRNSTDITYDADLSYNLTTGRFGVGIGANSLINAFTVNYSNSGAAPNTLNAGFALRNSDPTTNNYAAIAFQGVDTAGTAQGLVRIGAQFTSHTPGAQAANFYVDTSNGVMVAETIRCIGTSRQCYFTQTANTSTGAMSYVSTVPSLGGTIKIIGNTAEGLLVVSAAASPSPFFSTRGARGTMAIPTQTQANDEMYRAMGGGYTDTGWGSGVGGIQVKAHAAQTSTSQPSYLGFYTTPTGTITPYEGWRIGATGNLMLINKTTGYVGYYPIGDSSERTTIHIGSAGVLGDSNTWFYGNRAANGMVCLGANTAAAGAANEKTGLCVNATSGNARVGINTTAPAAPLDVRAETSTGLSIYAQGNISAVDVIERSHTYDTTKDGAALDKIKDGKAYLTSDGKINHSANDYYGVSFQIQEVIGYNYTHVPNETCHWESVKSQNNKTDCKGYSMDTPCTDIVQEYRCKDTSYYIQGQPITKNVTVEGNSMGKKLALLEQAVYELKTWKEQICLKHPEDCV